MSFAITELDRRVASLIRFGTVSEADYDQARVRVSMGEAESHWLPWLTMRAGGDRTWWAPEVGEQVLVLAPSGELAQGVVLGSLYQSAHPAPASSPDVDRREYKDGAVLEYNRKTHHLKAVIPGSTELETQGNIVAASQTEISITAPQIHFNGQTFVNGSLSQGQGTNGGSATFGSSLHAVAKISTDDDVVARVSLNQHQHDCPHGGETGAPK